MQFNLNDFAAFAAAKPADERYNPWDGQRCALAQFVQAIYPEAENIDAGFFTASMTIAGEDTQTLCIASQRPRWYDWDDRDFAVMEAIKDNSTWGSLARSLEALVK